MPGPHPRTNKSDSPGVKSDLPICALCWECVFKVSRDLTYCFVTQPVLKLCLATSAQLSPEDDPWSMQGQDCD